MKLRVFAAKALLGGAALAGCVGTLAAETTTWFTVIGDPTLPGETTIQVDPVPLAVSETQRTMVVRVSRPKERTSQDGVRFRSFESQVLFDCKARAARFIRADFYREPLWAGTSYKSLVYPTDRIRPMAFREIEPNPAERIIRAACSF